MEIAWENHGKIPLNHYRQNAKLHIGEIASNLSIKFMHIPPTYGYEFLLSDSVIRESSLGRAALSIYQHGI